MALTRQFTQDQMTTAKAAARLENLAALDVELKQSGAGVMTGPCPFCGEGVDRFHVYLDGQRFWCRRCNERGDLVQYVAKRRGLPFVDAVKWLLAGSLADIPQTAVITPMAAAPAIDPETWAAALEPLVYQAVDHLGWIKSPAASGAALWLDSRGITMQDAGRFGLGYVDGWRTFADGYKLPPGLIIPRWDHVTARLTAVNVYLAKEARKDGQRRRMVKGSQARSWFGAHLVGEAHKIIITEGELDAVLLSRFFLPYAPTAAVITPGSVTTVPDDLSLLDGREVVLLFDNDQAGQTAVKAWKELLPGAGVATVPGGVKDVTDYWQMAGDDGLAALADSIL